MRTVQGLGWAGLLVSLAACAGGLVEGTDLPLVDEPAPTEAQDSGTIDPLEPSTPGTPTTPIPMPSTDAGTPDAGPVIADPGTQGDGDFQIGPTYADAPEMTVPAGTTRGKIYTFTMRSADSAIYPGLNGAYTRAVAVYVPARYVNGTEAPFMVVQDGPSYQDNVVAALDSLTFARKLPPVVAVFVASGGGDGRGSERGLEYDRVSADYGRFVETELLPRVLALPALKADYPAFKLTANPEGRAAWGGSSGGSAAFTMGWFRPDLYRRILTYSGTFVNQFPEPAFPAGAWGYHQNLIPQNAAKPLRVFLEVGERDNNLDAQFGDGMHNWITANRAMAAALKAKGYHYRFVFAKDAAHVDRRVIRQTLPETLLWLWRGYPIP